MRALAFLVALLLASPAWAQGIGGNGGGGIGGNDPTHFVINIPNVGPTQLGAALAGALVTNATASNYISNANPAYFRNTRAALANVRAGLGSARILFVGDSTTFGSYSSGTATQYKVHSFPTVLAQFLSGMGLSAQDNNLVGFGMSTAENAGSNDPRFVLGVGTINNGVKTTGGDTLSLSTTGAASVFTPTGQTLGFKLWYITTPGGGTFSVSVDGGAATNINTNAAKNLVSQTFSASLGSHNISLLWVSGGTAFVAGIEGVAPTSGIVDILNAGWPTSKASDWNSGVDQWSPTIAIASWAPNLTFIDLGINDWMNAESIPVYTAGMQAIITAAKTTGDCVLVTPDPTAITVTPTATQIQYTAAAQALALSNNCGFIDGYSRWVSYEVTNPLGMYANTIHPNGQGYADWAQPYFTFLTLQ